jgi:hypothetical protein
MWVYDAAGGRGKVIPNVYRKARLMIIGMNRAKIIPCPRETGGNKPFVKLIQIKKVLGRKRRHGVVLGKGIEVGKNKTISRPDAPRFTEIR